MALQCEDVACLGKIGTISPQCPAIGSTWWSAWRIAMHDQFLRRDQAVVRFLRNLLRRKLVLQRAIRSHLSNDHIRGLVVIGILRCFALGASGLALAHAG